MNFNVYYSTQTYNESSEFDYDYVRYEIPLVEWNSDNFPRSNFLPDKILKGTRCLDLENVPNITISGHQFSDYLTYLSFFFHRCEDYSTDWKSNSTVSTWQSCSLNNYRIT